MGYSCDTRLSSLLLACVCVLTISACAFTFEPKPGMSIAEVTELAYVPCDGSPKINDQHLVFVGKHPESEELDVYRTLARVKYNRGKGRCQEDFIFKNGLLLSDDDAAIAIAKAQDQKRETSQRLAFELAEKKKNIDAKIEAMKKIIDAKGLSTMSEFKSVPDSDFKIWLDKSNKRHYSINYEFVSKNIVIQEITDFELELQKQEREKEKLAQSQRLMDEYRSLGGDIDSLKSRLLSAEWEAEIKDKIDQIKAAKKADIAREQCLGSGMIGICQSSSQNNSIYLCDGNGLIALANIFEPYCYTTDTVHIFSKMDVRNNLNKTVSDITFECSQIAKSGTVLVKNTHRIYDSWEPREVKLVKVKSIKHEQVARVDCRAVSWR